MPAREPVAVAVQQAVQLHEGQGAVPVEHSQAGAAQLPTAEQDRLASHRREHGLAGCRRTSAVRVLEAGPKTFADFDKEKALGT